MSNQVNKGLCDVCQHEAKVDYDDGHSYCFYCEKVSNTASIVQEQPKKEPIPLITNGEYMAIPTRRLTEDTCRKYGIQVGTDSSGGLVVLFNRYANGELVRQKVRPPDKKKTYLTGKGDVLDMYGSQSFDDPTNKHLVITEGEWDAPSCAQVLPFTYHSTSLDNGSSDVKKWLRRHMERLLLYKDITLCFDTDGVGQKAVKTFIESFSYGVIKVAHLPLKDASDMLKAGRSEELKWAIMKAPVVKPTSVVTVKDIKPSAMKKPIEGPPWPWPSFNKMTYGMQSGVTIIYGPTGCGKTEMGKDIMENNLENGILCGVISLEHNPAESLQRLTGAKIKSPIYLPDTAWNEEVISDAMDGFEEKIFWYQYKGVVDFNDILKFIYYCVRAKDVKYFWLDNLSAMLGHTYIDNERVTENAYFVHVISKLTQVAKELDVIIHLIAHNAKNLIGKTVHLSKSGHDSIGELGINEFMNPEGLTWESGRMADIGDIYGSGMLGNLVTGIWVLGRNRMAFDDREQRTLRCKLLKNKITSKHDGKTVSLLYDREQGKLREIESDISKQTARTNILGNAEKSL